MLVRVPKNTVVLQGTGVTFECSSDVMSSILYWYYSLCLNDGDVNKCIKHRIYTGYGVTAEYRPRFSVTSVDNATHKTRDLNINPTQLTDAGVYLCVEFIGVDVISTSSAQLVVLGMTTTYSRQISHQNTFIGTQNEYDNI